MAGHVAQQRSPGVQAELVGQGLGDERPGCMNMPAAIDMPVQRREPGGDVGRIRHPLLASILQYKGRRNDGIMASDQQPPGHRGRAHCELTCPLQLVHRQVTAGREMGPGRVKAEDGGLVVKRAEPGIRPGRGEHPEPLLE